MEKQNLYRVILVLFIINLYGVAADGLSVQLKRTNPGIAGFKSGELIFDVVNMDLQHEIEGFLLCRSPDDVVISSTLGVGSGSGAQYVSPLFNMDKGPSQKAMSLVIDSEVVGDARTGCILKYIPYTIEVVKLIKVFDNTTNMTTTQEETRKVYSKMNGETMEDVMDRDYRELRLDKSIPFVDAPIGKEPICPDGQSSCKAEEVEFTISKRWFMFGFVALLVLIIIGVTFMLGRSIK